MNLFLIYFILSVVNVILQTVKSICTVKCGKVVASIVNAVAYGLYTVVLVYTNADFPLWEKVVACAVTNLIGVFVVKLVEEKVRKDRLWKIELTVRSTYSDDVVYFLESVNIPYNYTLDETNRYAIFNVYCATQKESASVRELVGKFHAKYFVTESKSL